MTVTSRLCIRRIAEGNVIGTVFACAELPQRVQDTAQNADSCAPVALYGVKAAPEAVYAT